MAENIEAVLSAEVNLDATLTRLSAIAKIDPNAFMQGTDRTARVGRESPAVIGVIVDRDLLTTRRSAVGFGRVRDRQVGDEHSGTEIA